MRVMLRKKGEEYSVYVAKKDLEARVVEIEPEGAWGGVFTLANGWRLRFPVMDAEPKLPVTIEVEKLG